LPHRVAPLYAPETYAAIAATAATSGGQTRQLHYGKDDDEVAKWLRKIS